MRSKIKKNLIIVAHPNLANSHFSSGILRGINKYNNIINIISEKINNKTFCIKDEHTLIKNSDKIIFIFPIYWYAHPYTLAYWLEKVLIKDDEFDPFIILKNKKIQFILSTGGDKEEYSNYGKNGFTIEEFLNSLLMAFKYFAADVEQPIVFYTTWKLTTNELLKIGTEIV